MISHLIQYSAFELLAVVVALTGAITDVHSRSIPNRLTCPAMLAGLGLHLVNGGWSECRSSMFALLLCGAVFFVFHLAGGMGAGDVKLIAAEGCLLGMANVASLLVYTALCGGALGLVLAMRQGRLRETLTNVCVLTTHHTKNGLRPHPELNLGNSGTLRLPYAIPIAAGVSLTVLLPLLLRSKS